LVSECGFALNAKSSVDWNGQSGASFCIGNCGFERNGRLELPQRSWQEVTIMRAEWIL
jgi:hypothetical protein